MLRQGKVTGGWPSVDPGKGDRGGGVAGWMNRGWVWSMVEVGGAIRTDVWRVGRRLVHAMQDLGIEGWRHVVDNFTVSLFPEFPPSFDDVMHCDLQGDRLHLEWVWRGGRGRGE